MASIATNFFDDNKGFGLITYSDIQDGTQLFVADMIAVTDDNIPPYYYPNTIIDYKRRQYIDINYDSAFNRPLWTYLNSANPARCCNVRARHITDGGTLVRIVFYACRDIDANSELLMPYKY